MLDQLKAAVMQTDFFFIFLLPPIIFDAGFNLDVGPYAPPRGATLPLFPPARCSACSIIFSNMLQNVLCLQIFEQPRRHMHASVCWHCCVNSCHCILYVGAGVDGPVFQDIVLPCFFVRGHHISDRSGVCWAAMWNLNATVRSVLCSEDDSLIRMAWVNTCLHAGYCVGGVWAATCRQRSQCSCVWRVCHERCSGNRTVPGHLHFWAQAYILPPSPVWPMAICLHIRRLVGNWCSRGVCCRTAFPLTVLPQRTCSCGGRPCDHSRLLQLLYL